ncbi:cytosolic phospholipase A2-like [Orbicella faveolata]|uniref:cytosolic phospholipase A2-like n=1 Tax=Orbicella faveolata TaxID=48498 RepID=UPI0009E1A8EA|nr:cytosolic phospholipase A2-like [Orbicella faveolata]
MILKNEAVQETSALAQSLQASPRSCIAIRIKVLRARNVTQGWYDWIDTPDPYLMMRIPTSPEMVKRTKCVSNNKNPVWKEEPFVFHIDPEQENVLELTLWDEDYDADDQIGEAVCLPLRNIRLGIPESKTLTFGEYSEVDIILEASKVSEQYSDLRYSTDLCDEEKEFREKRKAIVFEAMNKMLGDQGPQTMDEVPTIAVLGSGGGYRATTGFSAACRALDEMDLLNCVTYLTGLSGSAWGLSLLYSQTAGENIDPTETQKNIREHLQWGPMWLLTPRRVMQYVKEITEKWKKGQPVKLTLWDEDYDADDQIGEAVCLPLRNIRLGIPESKTLKFGEYSEVDIILEASKVSEQYSDLRYSTDLCDEEKEFREKRKAIVFEAMNEMLGDQGPQTMDEVPTIAVLGSGGGYRATTGFSAACRALDEMDLLNCVTYLTGLSGSAWGLSLLYSQTAGENIDPTETQKNIREHLQWGPMWLLTPRRVMQYVKEITEKWKKGQPVSLTDFYGHCVGESLLGPKKNSVKLSHQQEKVREAAVPMPIYTAINSKRDVSAQSLAEWVEFTPYEIGMDKYGTFMRTELFGSKFFCGKLIEKFPESPLYYLQGIWGSFYAILLQRVLKEDKQIKSEEDKAHPISAFCGR